MYSFNYILLNYFPFEWNERRTSSIVFDERERGPEYEPDSDDMENLQKPDWWDNFEFPSHDEQESDKQRSPQEPNWAEDEYYFNLEYERSRGHDEFHYPDKYGWDQYA